MAELSAGERVARMEGQVESIDRDLQAHLIACEKSHEKVQERFTKLERIVWQATGVVSAVMFAAQFLGKH